MSFRGGGDAGGRAPKNAGPEYIRNIPKFLQKYDHLIEKREGQRVVRSSISGDTEDAGTPQAHHPQVDLEDNSFEDQIHGATIVHDERDSSSLPSCATVEEESNASKSSRLKDKGNSAFAKGEHKEAVTLFSEAIELDPSNSVLYSNRAAAHAALHEFSSSLSDAQKALALKPGWAKAHSRIGAALFGLRRYEDAVDAYKRALKLEPGTKTYKNGLEQAERKVSEAEEKEAAEGKHTFRKRKPESSVTKSNVASMSSGTQGSKEKVAKRSNKLSFDED